MKSSGDFPQFPKGFIFGAATAAYQIEGSWQADGKGPSIWDEFSHRKGKIKTGETADVAADHYTRWREDVALMKSLGLAAYRGSISWPRIFPEGRGRVNRAGIDFYSRLTDELLAADIEPFYTLFHWDLPLALERELGGFRNRDTAGYFADFVEAVVQTLGDRVRTWITINEPWEFSAFGHLFGDHAPGRHSPAGFFKVMHNLLRAHGLAMERIRSLCPQSQVGITLSCTPVFPLTGSARDAWSAGVANELLNWITFSPILRGRYPELLFKLAAPLVPRIETGDLELISRRVDFVGVNYYSRERASHRWYVPFLHTWVTGKNAAGGEFEKEGVAHTAMGWEVWPEGFEHILSILRTEYGNPPVYITENGAAFDDRLVNGKVHDTKRISFLRDYLASLSRAVAAGSDVRGYFVWSLIDNFEWAEGMRPRFGLIYIDFETGERHVKDSGFWYRDLIRGCSGGNA